MFLSERISQYLPVSPSAAFFLCFYRQTVDELNRAIRSQDDQLQIYKESLEQLDSQGQSRAELQVKVSSLQEELEKSRSAQDKLEAEAKSTDRKLQQYQVCIIRFTNLSSRNLSNKVNENTCY